MNLGVALDRVNRPQALRFVSGRAGLQDVNPADNGIEWRSQLVRSRRQELILELVGLFGDLPCRFRLLKRGGPFFEGEMQFIRETSRRSSMSRV